MTLKTSREVSTQTPWVLDGYLFQVILRRARGLICAVSLVRDRGTIRLQGSFFIVAKERLHNRLLAKRRCHWPQRCHRLRQPGGHQGTVVALDTQPNPAPLLGLNTAPLGGTLTPCLLLMRFPPALSSSEHSAHFGCAPPCREGAVHWNGFARLLSPLMSLLPLLQLSHGKLDLPKLFSLEMWRWSPQQWLYSLKRSSFLWFKVTRVVVVKTDLPLTDWKPKTVLQAQFQRYFSVLIYKSISRFWLLVLICSG